MKITIALLAVVACGLPPGIGLAQTSTIPWSTTAMGFEICSSSTSMVKSLVGQPFVGRLQGTNSIVEGGFLVDTLFRSLTGIRERTGLPTRFALEQNYPNPFNPTTTIQYALPRGSYVTLMIYNTLGQMVAELVNGNIEAGYHELIFNARDLASGVYFYRMQAGSYAETRKLVLMK